MKRSLLCIIPFSLLITSCNLNKNREVGQDTDSLRVITFNLWLGGEAGKQPLERSADIIRVSGAGIAGLQETSGYDSAGKSHDNAARIARILGWNYFDQGGYAILSAYPIIDTSATGKG